MRLPTSVHEAHPWVIREIAPDLRLLDVWALPAEGGPDDFGTLLDVMRGLDPADAGPVTAALFAARKVLGTVFRWDDEGEERPIPGSRDTTLAARVPAHLRGTASGATFAGESFTPLYGTGDEWAAEISNATVHGVLHLSWVPLGGDRWGGRLAVYVAPRGRLGTAYLKAIEPFRHLVVYPALMRQVGRAWDARERTAV